MSETNNHPATVASTARYAALEQSRDAESAARIRASNRLHRIVAALTEVRDVLGLDTVIVILDRLGMELPKRCKQCLKWREHNEIPDRAGSASGICKYCRELKRHRPVQQHECQAPADGNISSLRWRLVMERRRADRLAKELVRARKRLGEIE